MMTKFPAVYINHGGGPLPLLGMQPDVASSLRNLGNTLPRPRAIVVISAHFEAPRVTVMTSLKPSMLYDYYGFPEAAYQFQYSAPSDATTVKRVTALLRDANISHGRDDKRGFDHGMFVPLMLMYPKADVPVIGVAQPSSMDPEEIWRLGAALAPLRDEGVLILGSGASFHNFEAFFRDDQTNSKTEKQRDAVWSAKWDSWLRQSVCDVDPSTRQRRLKSWHTAPHARFAHPREEHLTPLLAVAAAAKNDPATAVEEPSKSHLKMSQFIFQPAN